MPIVRLLFLALAAFVAVPAVAQAQIRVPPRVLPLTPPTVVSVGDSAISGEAGRWAGNTNQSASKTDALGADAYYEGGGAEPIPGCHRSDSAEVHIGDGVRSVNLACSGARTYSRTSDGKWKPGLDFAVSGSNKGQALMLQELATSNKNIKAVVVLIGANDYGFADILETCVTNWITSPSWWKNYCHDDSNMKSMFSAANINAITNNVKASYNRIKQAMTNAGYDDADYEILAQTYSAPLPLSGGMRYPESGWSRQSVGGCGAWNADINWARSTVVDTLNNSVKNAVAGMPNVQLLDAVGALYGRRLCEDSVGLLEEKGVSTWQSPGAVDKTEWVHQIRTVSTIFGPYQLQEDGHPNYWGQLALRNCFRQAYNGGSPQGGSCSRGTGLNGKGEPNMTLG